MNGMRTMRTAIYLLVILLSYAAGASHAAMQHDQHTEDTRGATACQDAHALPSPHCGRAPTATFVEGVRDSVLYVVFSQNNHVYLSRSTDLGRTYSVPTAINTTPEAIYDDGENRPKILVGKDQWIYVSWTHKTPGRYAGEIRFTRSRDGGASFEPPRTINTDNALISHRFDSISQDSKGNLYLVWIDKRAQIKAAAEGQDYTGAALYYVVSHDQGASFSENRKLVDHSCECCRVALAQDAQGKVVAFWRHSFPGQIRDHAMAYVPETHTSAELFRATEDQWHLEGCPHHGPDLSIDARNIAHLAWFTQGSQHQGLIYGQFDLKTRTMSNEQVFDATPGASRPQVYAIGSDVYLVWKRFNGEATELLMRRSNDNGNTWSENQSLAKTQEKSDHPDFVTDKSRVYVAWQTQAEGYLLLQVSP